MRITEIKSFMVGPPIEAPTDILFLNRAGGWDSIQATRSLSKELKTKASLYASVDHFRVNAVASEKTITYYSQWYESRYFDWLQDLLLSPLVFVGGKMVKVQDASYAWDRDEDLFKLELKVSPKYEENHVRL